MISEYEQFLNVLDICDTAEISHTEIKGLTVIAGHCAHKHY